MEENLKSYMLDNGSLIIVTFDESKEDIVVSLYIALSIFSLFDDETFYFMK